MPIPKHDPNANQISSRRPVAKAMKQVTTGARTRNQASDPESAIIASDAIPSTTTSTPAAVSNGPLGWLFIVNP